MARNTVVKNQDYRIDSENDPLAELSRIMGLDSANASGAGDDVDFGIDLEKELLGDFDVANAPAETGAEDIADLDALFDELTRDEVQPAPAAAEMDFAFDAADFDVAGEAEAEVYHRAAAEPAEAYAPVRQAEQQADDLAATASWADVEPAPAMAEPAAPVTGLSFEEELGELLGDPSPASVAGGFDAPSAVDADVDFDDLSFDEPLAAIDPPEPSLFEPPLAAPRFQPVADEVSVFDNEPAFDPGDEMPEIAEASAEIAWTADTVEDAAYLEPDEGAVQSAYQDDAPLDELDAAIAGLEDDSNWETAARYEPSVAAEPAAPPPVVAIEGAETVDARFAYVEPQQPAAAFDADEHEATDHEADDDPFAALAALAAAPPILRALKRANPVAINPESAAPVAAATPIAPRVAPLPAAATAAPAYVAPVAAAASSPVQSYQKPVAMPVAEPETGIEPDFDVADFDLGIEDAAQELGADASQWQLKPSIDTAAPTPRYVEPSPAFGDSHDVADPAEKMFDAADAGLDDLLADDFAAEFETVEVADDVVAVADDLDLPELQAHEEPSVAQFDDFEADFADAFRQLGDAKRPSAPQAPAVARAPEQDVDALLDADFASFQRDFEANSGAFDTAGDFGFDPEAEVADTHRRSRLPLFGAIFAGLLLVAGVGAYATGMFGSSDTGGPALVRADSSPVKVKPETPGGVVVPNQDGQVYDRVAGVGPKAPEQQKLVSNVEEPIAPQPRPTGEALPGVESPAIKSEERIAPQETSAGPAEEQAVGIAPRKVRTMVVRPDGTLAPRPEPVAQEAPAAKAIEPVVAPVAEAPKAAEAVVAKAETPVAEPVVQEPAKVEEALAPKPVKTTTVKPKQATPEPEPQKVAVAPQPAPVDMAGGAAVTGSSESLWSVQIASQPTRDGAQASYESLARKYGGVIGGKGVNIVQANIEGKGTMWRVRIPAASKNDANILCAKLKTAGGSCFVSR